MTTRTEVREWLAERLAEKDEIALPALREAAIEHFANVNGFLERFMRENLPILIDRFVSEECRITRGGRRLLGDTIVSPQAMDQRVDAQKSRWGGWLEHAGTRHVRFMEMTRGDLFQAAAERRTRGRTEFRLAALMESVGRALGPRQRVRNKFTEEEIEALYEKVTAALDRSLSA